MLDGGEHPDGCQHFTPQQVPSQYAHNYRANLPSGASVLACTNDGGQRVLSKGLLLSVACTRHAIVILGMPSPLFVVICYRLNGMQISTPDAIQLAFVYAPHPRSALTRPRRLLREELRQQYNAHYAITAILVYFGLPYQCYRHICNT